MVKVYCESCNGIHANIPFITKTNNKWNNSKIINTSSSCDVLCVFCGRTTTYKPSILNDGTLMFKATLAPTKINHIINEIGQCILASSMFIIIGVSLSVVAKVYKHFE